MNIHSERLSADTQIDNSERSDNTKREKYLIFSLLDESYGMPLSRVKEVIGPTEITKTPNVPKYFKGLINLRGKIISIIDLRSKLNLPETDYKEKEATIIITEIGGFTIGTIVDNVLEVANFEYSQILKQPRHAE